MTMTLRLTLLCAICVPLPALPAKQRVEAVKTESVEFRAGGTIRVEGAIGQLNVVGWDEPRVEIAVTRYTYSSAQERARATAGLEAVQVSKQVAQNGDLTITVSHQHAGDTALDLQLMAPRGAHLVIREDKGDVAVLDVGGNVDATNRCGSIVLQLPQPGDYAIEASAGMGGVTSDFDGESRRRRLVGEIYSHKGGSQARTIHLRTKAGGIAIQKMEARPARPGIIN